MVTRHHQSLISPQHHHWKHQRTISREESIRPNAPVLKYVPIRPPPPPWPLLSCHPTLDTPECPPFLKTTQREGPPTPADGKAAAPQPLAAKQAAPAGGGKPKADGVRQALRLLGGGVVATKDAFWASLDVLGDAVDAATKAPETAKDLVAGGKAALEGGRTSTRGMEEAGRKPPLWAKVCLLSDFPPSLVGGHGSHPAVL